VKAGTVRLVGTSEAKIVREIERLLGDPKAYRAMSRSHNPYGDGKASGRIIRALRSYLGVNH
jgi:UDP-N-acetylglucosamine 2-epimerase (non-hydrolysing)